MLSRGDRGKRHGVRLASFCYFEARVVLAGAVFLLAHPLTQWQAEQSSVVAELGCRRHTSENGGFQKNFTFFAAFALGNVVHYFLLVLVFGRHFLRLGVACEVQGLGFVERLLLRRLWKNFTHFHRERGLGS